MCTGMCMMSVACHCVCHVCRALCCAVFVQAARCRHTSSAMDGSEGARSIWGKAQGNHRRQQQGGGGRGNLRHPQMYVALRLVRCFCNYATSHRHTPAHVLNEASPSTWDTFSRRNSLYAVCCGGNVGLRGNSIPAPQICSNVAQTRQAQPIVP